MNHNGYHFSNSSGEVIPPGGVVEPTGQVDADGRIVVRKPTVANSLAVLLNGMAKVDAGGVGQGFSPYPAGVFAVHPSDAPGDRAAVGVKAGGWFLRTGQTGFMTIGGFDAHRFMNAVPDPAGAGSSLSTRNVNGTAVLSPTADLRVDQATGVILATVSGYQVLSGVAAGLATVGVVSTVTQSFGGPKTSRTGTDGSLAAWHSLIGPFETLNPAPSPPFPFNGPWWTSFSASTSGSSAYTVTHYALTSTTYAAPANVTQTVVSVGAGVAAASTVYFPRLTFMADSSGRPLVAVGVPEAEATVGYRPQHLAVWRQPGGVPTLHVGIDRDFASGDRPIVRGGIIVGFNNP